MIKLGVNVRNFGPTATPENFRRCARFAEDAGFTLAVMSDHVVSTPDVNEIYPTPFYDPFSTLSWLAGVTQRLELGTSVAILPYRHPLNTARVAANVDQFSGGRFVLGVGVGWSAPEFAALDVPFHQRGRITDEYLAAIKAAWANDVVSLDGEFVAYSAVTTGPKSVRLPHPPIWVGGSSPAAIRRAARFGDAWHPINPDLNWLRDVGIPALRRAADTLDRPMPALCPRIRARPTTSDLPGADRLSGVGSLAQIVADIEALVAMGAEYVVLDPNRDHSRDERPLDDDWHDLSAIVERAADMV